MYNYISVCLFEIDLTDSSFELGVHIMLLQTTTTPHNTKMAAMRTSEIEVMITPLSVESCRVGNHGKEIRKGIKYLFVLDYLPVT
jgi:hypothetical protein